MEEHIKRPIIIDNTPPHSTVSLYEAAYLMTVGAKLVGRRKSGFKTVFDFEAPNIEQLVNAWLDGTGQVSANGYAQRILMLKAVVIGDRGTE